MTAPWNPESALIVALALPLLASLGIAFADRSPNLRETITLVASLVLLVVVVSLFPAVVAGDRPTWEVLEVLPGLSLSFTVEPLGMLFAAIAAGLWPLNSLYSIGYMRGNDEKHQTRFYVCFAIAIASALGVAFAGNLLTLFICYEALTLSTYPLVTHKGNADAVRAGRIYLGLLLTTSIGLLLPAIVWTYFVAGTVDFRPGGILAGNLDTGTAGILLALFLFGIGKAALMPFHRWLPSAMVAPTPVSALLHAVAVVKAGVFTVLKVVVYIFGVDYLHGSDGSFWLTVVAAFTLLTASIIAITKDNLKARLAYSTVSQLAYVVLGAALATATGVLGGAFQIAMHAMGKITLFFCAGAIYTAAHKTEISQMDGLGRTMPLTYIAFFLGALSIIGLPPFGGAWSKWYLMLGAADAEQTFAIVVLMMSSLLSLGYLIPIVARGFFLAPPGGFKGIAEAPWFCLVPLMITATGCIILFFAANNLYQLLEPIIQTSIDENLSHGN